MSRHGLTYFVGAALQGLAVLLVTPFATRVLGSDEYGRVAVAIVLIQMVATVLAAGFPQLILRDHQRGEEGQRSARVLVGLMMTGGALLAVLGAAVVLGLGAAGVVAPLTPFAVVLGAAGLTCVIACQSLSRARERPFLFLILAVASTLGALLAGILAAARTPTATAFLTGYMVTLCLLAVVAALIARPIWPWRARGRVGALLGPALALVPHGAAMLILLSGDTVIAGATRGAGASADYQPALVLGNVTFVAATALYNAWGPAIYRRPPESRWSWMTSSAVELALGLVVVAAIVVATSVVTVPILAPGSHGFDVETIRRLVGLLAWTAIPYIAYLGCSLVLIEHGRAGALATITTSVAVVFVGAGVAASALLGLDALALVKLGSYVLLAGIALAVARRWEPVRFRGSAALVAAGVPALCVALIAARAPQVLVTVVVALSAVVAAAVAFRRRAVLGSDLVMKGVTQG